MYQINITYSDTPEVVIGIDHGYGNIKTANFCFSSGVIAYDREPTFQSNMLIYDGHYYIIGEDHKEFVAEKMTDDPICCKTRVWISPIAALTIM